MKEAWHTPLGQSLWYRWYSWPAGRPCWISHTYQSKWDFLIEFPAASNVALPWLLTWGATVGEHAPANQQPFVLHEPWAECFLSSNRLNWLVDNSLSLQSENALYILVYLVYILASLGQTSRDIFPQSTPNYEWWIPIWVHNFLTMLQQLWKISTFFPTGLK